MLSRNGTAWTADRVLSERPCLPDSPGTECSMLYGAFGQLIWPSRNLEIYHTGRTGSVFGHPATRPLLGLSRLRVL